MENKNTPKANKNLKAVSIVFFITTDSIPYHQTLNQYTLFFQNGL